MRYTRSYSGSNAVFVTTYKLYHPVKGTHALTITATHYKDDQKVVVKINDTSGSIFSEINTQQTTYEGTPLAPFGFRGTAGALGGPNVPDQLALQFASGKAENVKVLSVIGSGEDFEFFVLDKAAVIKPVADTKPSDAVEAKALYGGGKHTRPKTVEVDTMETPTAEEVNSTGDDDKIYTSVNEMPQLPGGGGNEAISEAIQNATKYPALALRNQVRGRVLISFIVEPQGDVSDVRVVNGRLGSGLDEEVVEAVKSLPAFLPGKKAGQPVRVSLTVPVVLSSRPR